MMFNDLHSRKGIHLSLGGGAARGLAHIGIIQVLEEEGIPIASICGSSMGAFVGGLYALYGETASIIDGVKRYTSGELYLNSILAKIPPADQHAGFLTKIKRGILVGKAFMFGKVITFEEWYGAMREMVPDKCFADTRIPFMATGLDLTRAREVLFVGGSLRSAITASCSIPGVFPPVQSGNTVFVDGGWVDKVPVRPLLQFGARDILAVNVSNMVEIENPEPSHFPGYSVILKSYAVVQKRLDEIQMEDAPLTWNLPVDDIEWSDFREIDRVVQIGRAYAKAHIGEVRQLLSRQKGWKGMKRTLAVLRDKVWKKTPAFKPVPTVEIGKIEPLGNGSSTTMETGTICSGP